MSWYVFFKKTTKTYKNPLNTYKTYLRKVLLKNYPHLKFAYLFSNSNASVVLAAEVKCQIVFP